VSELVKRFEAMDMVSVVYAAAERAAARIYAAHLPGTMDIRSPRKTSHTDGIEWAHFDAEAGDGCLGFSSSASGCS
jgi:hypothetical protein